MTNIENETVKSEGNTAKHPSKEVVFIKTAASGFLLLVFYPALMVAFGGFLLTHDTVWLERALAVLKYSTIGFVSVLALCSVISGISQLHKAFSVLRSKK